MRPLPWKFRIFHWSLLSFPKECEKIDSFLVISESSGVRFFGAETTDSTTSVLTASPPDSLEKETVNKRRGEKISSSFVRGALDLVRSRQYFFRKRGKSDFIFGSYCTFFEGSLCEGVAERVKGDKRPFYKMLFSAIFTRKCWTNWRHW